MTWIVDLSTNIDDSCELGTPLQVSVVAATRALADISAYLKCVANPSATVQGDVVQRGVGTYSIALTPQVRGRHDLIVKVKDKEIAGSPFRVVVKIPPTQLEQPLRIIDGIVISPWGIAINNKRQLVVVTCKSGGKKITIMERDGKNVQTIECSEFQEPQGVATAPDGAIYVTDMGAQCLFKFDMKGKLLKTVCNELQYPISVKIIQNELYVVDFKYNSVKIFDMECNVVGTIQTKECSLTADIALGPDGLYVASSGKISVYECSPNGKFIRHLNIPSTLLKTYFNGICFDSSGHVIITDNVHGVYVFKPSGEYVALLGRDLKHVGRMTGSAGVVVDEDGFLYVCGHDSNNVIVF